MSRVITFSTRFRRDHPRAGEPTYFVEKIMAWCADNMLWWEMNKDLTAYDWYKYYNCGQPKRHTIRAGERWKVGDRFSPRIWSGTPRRSKQIIIGPDMEVKKIIPIATDGLLWFVNYKPASNDLIRKICINDGLSYEDFVDWFYGMAFSGQIVCWDANINYDSNDNTQWILKSGE